MFNAHCRSARLYGDKIETYPAPVPLFKIAPGFQWTYFVSRFSFFGGFEAPFTYQTSFTQTENVIDTFFNSQTATVVNTVKTVPGGYSVGLGFFAGSTFYYKSVFGIGLEIADAYEYSKLGGTIKSTIISRNGAVYDPTVYSQYDEELTAWKFSPFQASIQLSLRF